jgi:hypothetical protein
MKMTKLIVSAVSALALMTGLAGAAAADSRCSDVQIEVENNFIDPVSQQPVRIKVVDLDYWDAEDIDWREEWTDNKRINAGDSDVWNKNLEYVGGEGGVVVRIHYRYDQSGGGWSSVRTENSPAFTCIDGTEVLVTVE